MRVIVATLWFVGVTVVMASFSLVALDDDWRHAAVKGIIVGVIAAVSGEAKHRRRHFS